MKAQSNIGKKVLTGLISAAIVIGSLTAAPAAMAAPPSELQTISAAAAAPSVAAPTQLGGGLATAGLAAPALGPVKAAVYKYPWYVWIIACVSFTGIPINNPICKRGPA